MWVPLWFIWTTELCIIFRRKMQADCIYRAESTGNHLFVFPRAFLGHTSAQIQFTKDLWKPGYHSKVHCEALWRYQTLYFVKGIHILPGPSRDNLLCTCFVPHLSSAPWAPNTSQISLTCLIPTGPCVGYIFVPKKHLTDHFFRPFMSCNICSARTVKVVRNHAKICSFPFKNIWAKEASCSEYGCSPYEELKLP